MMRIVKLAFLCSFLMFIFVVIKVPAQSHQSANPAFESIITILALACSVVGYFGKQIFGSLTKRASTNKTTKSNPLSLWMAGNVFSLACIEACVLFGVVLHFVGARVRLVELLFSVGIIVLLIWSPGIPPVAEQGQPFQS